MKLFLHVMRVASVAAVAAMTLCLGCGDGEGDAADDGSALSEGSVLDGGGSLFARSQPFVAEPAKDYDPRPRYVYSLADVDGNGQRDSIVFDRDDGMFAVRLYGAFPTGHPYAGVDQKACGSSFWKHNLSPTAAGVNLDYCNAVVRPEENWGSVPLADKERDRVRILKGHFQDPTADSLLVWDEHNIVFAQKQIGPDPIGGRAPAIQNRLSFAKSPTIDLSRLDVCQVPNLHPIELAQCASNRWHNLARLWESVAIGDLNEDGLDDVIGLVAINDADPNTQLGMWALLSKRVPNGSGSAVDWQPQHLGNVSANYRGASTFVGDFDGSGGRQLVFVRPNDQVVSALRFTCRRDGNAPGGPCSRVTARDSIYFANLAQLVSGSGPMKIDDLEVGRFVSTTTTDLRLRIKRTSEPRAKDYVLHRDAFSPASPTAMKLATWSCPWQASALDAKTANATCLGAAPLANPAATQTRIVQASQCENAVGNVPSQGDCRSVIQAHLDDPNVRNVILDGSGSGGATFPIAGNVRLSTLDANANPTAQTKRLIGTNNATIVARSRYHRVSTKPDGSYDVTDIVPSTPEAIRAEVLEHEKCREFRAYDDFNKTTRTGAVEYHPNLTNRFVALRDRYIVDHCGVVETMGNNISISDLTIDTDELGKISQKRGGALAYDSISLGFYANGWAMPYDMFGAVNTNARHRINDTSRSADENLQMRRLRFVHHATGAIATYATPSSVRDTIVEDVRCEAFPSPNAVVTSNCIELDASPVGNYPYDTRYREHIPFGATPIENFLVRKGPHADSVCDMTGNSETVRVSGAIGFVVEDCRIQKGIGNSAFFLYVTDTGAKLDATLRRVNVYLDLAKVPSIYHYNLNPIPYIPRRFDANGKELFQGHPVRNAALIQIIGKPITRSGPVNYRTDLDASDPQLARNKLLNASYTYFGLNYIYRDTPSQVFIDGLQSDIDVGTDINGPDSLYRAHIKEGVGLTGKFICKDCSFDGGGQVFSADFWDLVGYTTFCLNDPSPGNNPANLTTDQKTCTGATHDYFVNHAPGQKFVLGYKADGSAETLLDPNQHWARAHGSWFEFIKNTSSNIHQPRAVSIIPGSMDLNYAKAYRATPNDVKSFSKLVNVK